MNKIQLFWNRLEQAAKKQAATLHNTTGFEYRVRRFPEGVSIEGYSPITAKWYNVKVVRTLDTAPAKSEQGSVLIAVAILMLIIVAGMYIVGHSMGVDFNAHVGPTCYDYLNAAGQIIGNSCH